MKGGKRQIARSAGVLVEQPAGGLGSERGVGLGKVRRERGALHVRRRSHGVGTHLAHASAVGNAWRGQRRGAGRVR